MTVELTAAGASLHLPAPTADFTGRAWVFDEVARWLAAPDAPRHLLITGEPGSGKSALASRLWELSSGAADVAAPLAPGFLAAAHACSARDTRSVDPRHFALGLSLQLARRFPAFAAALPALADAPTHIHVDQRADSMTGSTLTGVVIERLVLNSPSEEDAFHRFVRDPLEHLYAGGFAAPVTLLVDALDEALGYSRPVKIVQLIARVERLSPRVRFIVTSREDARVTGELRDADVLSLSTRARDGDNRGDLLAYVDRRLGAAAPSARPRAELLDAVASAADGNFLYARFLLDAGLSGRRGVDDLAGLPEGLDALYERSLTRVVERPGRDWLRDYAPLLGLLSVAMEPVTAAQLRRWSGLAEDDVSALLGELEQFVEAAPDPSAGAATYRLYHQSVADFLRKPDITAAKRPARNPYRLAPAPSHRRVADETLRRGADPRAWDLYSLRYVARHLAEAAAGSDADDRAALVERLVGLVGDARFQGAYAQRVRDLPGLQADLGRAVQAAAATRHPGADVAVLQASAAHFAFRREHLDPARPFEQARRGELAEAEGSLGLFTVEPEWRRCALLLLAWIASDRDPAAARSMRDRVVRAGERELSVELLGRHLDAALNHTAHPSRDAWPAPPDDEVEGIVQRMGAALALSSGRVEGANDALDESEPGERAGQVDLLDREKNEFFAAWDGPRLVGYALARPPEGERLIEEYLRAHTGYGYAYYRNGSLLALLPAVLLHPDVVWVRRTAERVARVALNGSSVEAPQALPLSALALRARAGLSGASAALIERLTAAGEGGRAMAWRQLGDTWGAQKRLLVAAAEAAWLMRDAPPVEAPTPPALLDLAGAVPFGFAGFQVPAYLALAEASEVVGEAHRAGEFLLRALSGAHNVRDRVLCARLTARVHAMERCWWAAGAFAGGVAATVERFVRDPESPEFLPTHRVGERYGTADPTSPSARFGGRLPPAMLDARSLREVAAVWRLDVAALQRTNPDVAPDEVLAEGVELRAPDPGFRAWLAARLSARCLADPAPTADDRVDLIRSLVPAALASPVHADAVLSRLLLAASPTDGATLDALTAGAERFVRAV